MTDSKSNKKALKRYCILFFLSLLVTIVLALFLTRITAYAATNPGVSINLNTANETDGALGALEVLFLLVLVGFLPSILIMMTSFTRIVIVLSFLRNALGTQQTPPNQIIIGLALFLTLFIMYPVVTEINTVAYEPYKAGTITQETALNNAIKPLKVFMLKETKIKDLNLFISISKTPPPANFDVNKQESLQELGLEIIVPSFITSELKRAFSIGFLLFLPFLIIDMVVSSTLMSMGMVMLPPTMIALPFKILMFVLVDGWNLILSTLVKGFG